jgi:glycerophosphoryl diester phosphodiesterase
MVMSTVLRIGHRGGAAGYTPENTLASARKALELPVDMIELDIHRCASGELVVIHDDTLERTTNGTGDVADKTLAELRTLDAGSGEKIPLLTEFLDLVDRKAAVNIELKDPDGWQPLIALLGDYISSRGWSADDFLVSSFDHLVLWKLKEQDPRFRIGALAAAIPDGFAAFAKDMQAFSVNVSSASVTDAFIEEAHRYELKVYVYTVNEPAEIARMKSLGVDGIFSDFPDRI